MSTRPPHRGELLAQAARADLPAWDPDLALPWADPAFSARVLKLHLDGSTPAASRAAADVRRHIDWLDPRLGPGPVLDLCCGPGLYCHELARRGRRTLGLDLAPAALAYARETAATEGLACEFRQVDLARPAVGLAGDAGPFAAITCWFGDFHIFRHEAATRLLADVTARLAPGGLLVLEMQPWEDTVQEDEISATETERSIFADGPHLWVRRSRWDAPSETEVHGHWIVRADSGTLSRYVQCLQAWHPDRLAGVMAACGLEDPVWYEPIVGLDAGYEFPVLVARRATAEGGA